MAEYIERNKIFSVWRSMPAPASVTSLSAAIHQTPVIEIVRCKDCKQWCRNIGIVDSPNGHCFCHDIETNGHDFCSYGERKMVSLEDIVDLDAQAKANNEAMRKVIAFMTGERSEGE